MKYTPATIAKALVAFVTAFGGAAATSVPHDPVSWAGCLGSGLVAFAAVFATPNKSNVSPDDVAIGAINEIVVQAKASDAAIKRVGDAARAAVGDIPVLGPLARQAIDSLT